MGRSLIWSASYAMIAAFFSMNLGTCAAQSQPADAGRNINKGFWIEYAKHLEDNGIYWNGYDTKEEAERVADSMNEKINFWSGARYYVIANPNRRQPLPGRPEDNDPQNGRTLVLPTPKADGGCRDILVKAIDKRTGRVVERREFGSDYESADTYYWSWRKKPGYTAIWNAPGCPKPNLQRQHEKEVDSDYRALRSALEKDAKKGSGKWDVVGGFNSGNSVQGTYDSREEAEAAGQRYVAANPGKQAHYRVVPSGSFRRGPVD